MSEQDSNEQDEIDETFEIELIAMAHGGSALGRHDKRTIFIPYTIPGERVQAVITQDKGRIAFAEGLTLVEASGDRVFPTCKHFGPHKCGSCQWQHIDYQAQALLKQDVLADQLSRVGKFDDAVIEAALRDILPADNQWHYNHQMTFTVQNGQLGFPKADKDGIILVDECHILHPTLFDMYQTLDFEFENITKVTFQLGTDGEHMIILYVEDEENLPELHADLPTSVNVILPDNEPVNLIGDSHVIYEVDGHHFRVTAGSAFRANVSQLPKLAELVVDALDINSKSAVLDLYAGVGFFSAFIADKVSLVTLIESFPPAVTDADENLEAFDNVDVIEGAIEDVLAENKDKYDCAILDPPSGGLSVEVMDILKARSIPRLVYVSSDPATLARDGSRLVKQGYRLLSIQPIDLNPQTYYVDSVAVFVK